MDREHNIHGSPRLSPDTVREELVCSQLQHSPVHLDASARSIVEISVRNVREYRNWHLHALAVRTNHVHVVVSASLPPEKVMHSIKAYATREMRIQRQCNVEDKLWTRHGSTRYLWTPEALRGAVFYVMEGQGGELPGGTQIFAIDIESP